MDREMYARYRGYTVILSLMGFVIALVAAGLAMWYFLWPINIPVNEKVQIKSGYIEPLTTASLEIGSVSYFKLRTPDGTEIPSIQNEEFIPPLGLERFEQYLLYVPQFEGKWNLTGKEVSTVLIRGTSSATLYPSESTIVETAVAAIFVSGLVLVWWIILLVAGFDYLYKLKTGVKK